MWGKKPINSSLPTLPESVPAVDEFLQGVSALKAQADAIVETASKEHQIDLKRRYGDDLRLKERLSEFARSNGLDQALIDLWEGIRFYPAWSQRDDFDQLNILGITSAVERKADDKQIIDFGYEGRPFSVTFRSWWGHVNGDSYANFTLLENGEEVFAISCKEHNGEYETSYECISVDAFKKRGHWANALVRLGTVLRTANAKRDAELRFIGADKIRGRFEE